jgi:hypothetical protein
MPPDAPPHNITASHCWQGDSPSAVADKVLPKDSSDQSIPRFTWYSHKGTKEWIQSEFGAPRRVTSVRVYWFDDRPTDGVCRTPESWRLLYRKGGAWVAVGQPGTFGVATNKFNETKFAQVETDALRIEVQLRPGFSGGILEWEIP